MEMEMIMTKRRRRIDIYLFTELAKVFTICTLVKE